MQKGVIYYYPYDGFEETRPRVLEDQEDQESATVEVFWEGRQVNEENKVLIHLMKSTGGKPMLACGLRTVVLTYVCLSQPAKCKPRPLETP